MRDRGSQLPRRHRAEHAQTAAARRNTRTDRLNGIGEHAGMARQRTAERIELHEQRSEHRTHHLGVAHERAQPAAHRRCRPGQPRGNRPVPGTSGLHPQRGTDDLDRVGPAQQARHRQQHMRHQATATACATWPQLTHSADSSLAAVPPRSETTPARASKLTSPKTSFDLADVRTYDDHGCLQQHQETALPSGQGAGRAVALPERDQLVVAHEQRATRKQPL